MSLARVLIKAGSDVNARDINGRGPLYHAVIGGFREMTDLLIANMASVFAFDYHGNSVSNLSLDPTINLSLQRGYMYQISIKFSSIFEENRNTKLGKQYF